MKNIILSHSGKQHSYHVAKALKDMGLLEKFYTSSYVTSPLLQSLIRTSGNAYWSRRFLDGLYGNLVESNWRFELKEILYGRLYGQSQKTLNAVYQRDEKFDQYMAHKLSMMKVDAFWGFQGSCLHSLKAARAGGKLAICELATGHAPAAKKILSEEKKLHPEWTDSFVNLEFPEAYYQRLCIEPHEADYVIGASHFTLSTLKEDGVPDHKLRVLPLGCETSRIPFQYKETKRDGPLKLLYAGRVTQSKGIKYLLEAMRFFNKADVELHMIGNIQGSGEALRNYQKVFTLHPALSQYELFRGYREFDALVLPSIFEGFGLVIIEALAAGLPVITTTHTMGPEVIREGKNGYIVPIRDTGAIAKAIEQMLSKNSEEISAMRQFAHESAQTFDWLAYKDRLKVLFNTL